MEIATILWPPPASWVGWGLPHHYSVILSAIHHFPVILNGAKRSEESQSYQSRLKSFQ